jgi:uncharacterized membrane protein
VLTAIPLLDPSEHGTGLYVGAGGIVAGTSFRQVGTQQQSIGWIWQNGTTQQFILPGATYGDIRGMNDAGVAIGFSGDSATGRRGVVWQNGVYSNIGTAGTDSSGFGWSDTIGVSPSGTVAASSDVYDSKGDWITTQAATWRNNTPTMLPGLKADAETYAYSVNRNDVAVGYSDPATGTGWTAVKWVSGTPVSLGTLGGGGSVSKSNATEINSKGDIAGKCEKFVGGVDKGLRGVVWRGGTMQEIGCLGADANGQGYSNVWKIGEGGQVVGTTKKIRQRRNLCQRLRSLQRHRRNHVLPRHAQRISDDCGGRRRL